MIRARYAIVALDEPADRARCRVVSLHATLTGAVRGLKRLEAQRKRSFGRISPWPDFRASHVSAWARVDERVVFDPPHADYIAAAHRAVHR